MFISNLLYTEQNLHEAFRVLVWFRTAILQYKTVGTYQNWSNGASLSKKIHQSFWNIFSLTGTESWHTELWAVLKNSYG